MVPVATVFPRQQPAVLLYSLNPEKCHAEEIQNAKLKIGDTQLRAEITPNA
jgi:hypothetical protein